MPAVLIFCFFSIYHNCLHCPIRIVRTKACATATTQRRVWLGMTSEYIKKQKTETDKLNIHRENNEKFS